MVQTSGTRTRANLLHKFPLVPYADDGEETRKVIAVIQNEMASYGDTPQGLDKMDKQRPRWSRQLREARYKDFIARKAAAVS